MPDSTNAEILRFAQNDSASEFFRSLLKPLNLQGLKASLEGLAIVGPKSPTPYLEIYSAKLGHYRIPGCFQNEIDFHV